ncbi:succinate dehydrogenase [Paenibacillus albiflavus]|uniref:Succinate dehydrogenase n=1 Tax=Paenibacillus albiflavus TaxID=2545760 RepID=A0A4R4E7V1_9BACL|nr:succinate dehydrogenase cytochrome b558 subunit [Paenibacillus albiflavus]TCZ75826.1 succinate dehydrogenase [Paenibacillus albiflavus]
MSNSYLFRKIHSLLGIVPVGAFLIMHLISNYAATKGHGAFVEKVLWINSLPLVFFLELLFIWLPLTYHAVYGLYVAYTARHNAINYGYFRNQMFLWQRITGVVTFLFVAWHVFETRVQVALGNIDHQGLGVAMHDIFANPIYLTIYVVAVIMVSFHFCNGIWGFLVSWGLTVGPRAQKVSTIICMLLFVVMSVMFILSIVSFTGAEFEQIPAGIK